MHPDLSKLLAKPGDRVAPRWNALLRWLDRQLGVRWGGGIRSRQGPDGISLVAEPAADVWQHPWQVVQLVQEGGRGWQAHVRPGRVNGLLAAPWPRPRKTENGKRKTENELLVVAVPPQPDGASSWLVVEVDCAEDTGSIRPVVPGEVRPPVRLLHLGERELAQPPAAASTGRWPVVLVEWAAGQPVAEPYALHPLVHGWARPGGHVFCAG